MRHDVRRAVRPEPHLEALEENADSVTLDHGEKNRAVACVLRDLLPPLITLLLQLLKIRNHRGEKLEDDRGTDIRHDAERENCGLGEVTPGEQVIQSEQRSGVLLKKELQGRRIHTWRRYVATQPIYDQNCQSEENTPPQLRNLEYILYLVDHFCSPR